jgi:hypothetical protein
MAENAIQQKSFLSGRVAHFTESVIREMTRACCGAVNLSGLRFQLGRDQARSTGLYGRRQYAITY